MLVVSITENAAVISQLDFFSVLAVAAMNSIVFRSNKVDERGDSQHCQQYSTTLRLKYKTRTLKLQTADRPTAVTWKLQRNQCEVSESHLLEYCILTFTLSERLQHSIMTIFISQEVVIKIITT